MAIASPTETTTVLIADEASRRIAEFLLWSPVHSLCSELGGLGAAMSPGDMTTPASDEILPKIDETLARLTSIRASADHVRGAKIGSTVELPISHSEFREDVSWVVANAIEMFSESWSETPDDRDTMIAILDAGKRLVAELPAAALA